MPNNHGNQGFTQHNTGAIGNCEYCGRHLRRIGIERKNGKSINNKSGKDWIDRKYHKGCYKKVQREEVYEWARTSREKEEIVISFD